MQSPLLFCCAGLLLLHAAAPMVAAVEVAGVKVELAEPAGTANVSAALLGKHKLRIDVDPRGERQPLTIRVELPASGRGYWPAEDVEVLDSAGQPVAAKHKGIEWHKFTFRAPPKPSTYLVHTVVPAGDRPRVFPDKERQVTDPVSGLSATIAKWFDGRRAALCIRFDDSHPTHLSKAIPILRQYGFRATFMINPGARDQRCPPRWRSAFQEHRAEWEAVARRGDQEFANHTLHHRGAIGDDDMEREIGGAAEVIWKLFPHRSRLLALNLGGGTWWETKRTLRYYLDKYPSFIVTGSLGMDDTYGNRVAVFRQVLERSLSSGLGWCKIHFHSIGKGCASSEENFRAVLDIVKQHESDLWITGLADAYKYLTERRGAKLSLENRGPRRVLLRLTCSTDEELFDQPLSIDVRLPDTWAGDRVLVTNAAGNRLETRSESSPAGRLLRFHVPPTDAQYFIEQVASK